MSMIQRVKELPDVHFDDPTTSPCHGLLPQRLQRLVRRSPGPKAVRTVPKVLLVERFQHHDHRPLEDLVLVSRDAQGPRLGTGPLGNVHSSHRRRAVHAGLGPVQKRLQVAQQVRFIVLGGLSVHAHRTVPARLQVRLVQPTQVDVMGQRRESHLRRLLGQLRYPLLSRVRVVGFRSPRPVSLQRLHAAVPPFLPRVPLGSVPLVRWYYEVLRLPTAPLAALRFLRLAIPPRAPAFVSPTSPTPAGGLGFSGLATPSQSLSTWRRPGLSGSWETSPVSMPCS